MNFTHQKRPYRAVCLQWDGSNTKKVLDMVGKGATLHGPEAIMVRHDKGINTIYPGYWVVKGENAEVKVYSDAVFQTKYEGTENAQS